MSSQYIAVPQAGGDALGAITYWTLHGGQHIERGKLIDALAAVGIEERHAPMAPSTQNLLIRACRHAGGNRYVVRSKGAMVHVIGEDADKTTEESLHLSSAAIFCLTETADGQDAVKVLRDNINFGSRIIDSFVAMRDVFTSEDVSQWLTWSAERHQAVRMRGAGGVYFVPQPKQADWNMLADALGLVSKHRVYRIPALKVTSAADAVIDALMQECTAMMDDMVEFVQEQNTNDKPAPRAAATRLKKLDGMKDKIALYAGAVDRNLDALQDRLKSMRATIEAQKDTVGATEVIAVFGGVA
jgi:hypothetical protein